MQNLIFLDSRDLIECIEHSRPLSHAALGAQLRQKSASIILTMTNVLETVPRNRPIAEAVDLLARLESLPHVFVRYSELSLREFQEAVRAFHVGATPSLSLPICASFWRTLVPSTVADDPALAASHRGLDRLPMSEQIRLVLAGGAQIGLSSNEFDPENTSELAAVLATHRDILGVRQPNKTLFRHSVETQLNHFGLAVSDVTRFADWMFRSPMACPAWRLGHEAFQELRVDQTAGVTGNGVTDLTHVYFLPYAAAATLDNQWREYCHRAARRLAKIGITLPYIDRLYANVRELLQGWRVSGA